MKRILITFLMLLLLISCEISPPSGGYTNNVDTSNLSLELPNEFYINQNLTIGTTKLSVTDNNDNPSFKKNLKLLLKK